MELTQKETVIEPELTRNETAVKPEQTEEREEEEHAGNL